MRSRMEFCYACSVDLINILAGVLSHIGKRQLPCFSSNSSVRKKFICKKTASQFPYLFMSTTLLLVQKFYPTDIHIL